MTSTTTHKYQPGDAVTIPPPGATPWPATSTWPASITRVSNGWTCGSCHCSPTNPDHLGDGSLCCPGPWYEVSFACPDGDHEHQAVYAEHELDPATP